METKIKRIKQVCLYSGILLLMLSASYLIYDHCIKEREIKEEKQLIEEFKNTEIEVIETPENMEIEDESSPEQIYYSMVIEIPSIKLEKGLCSIGQTCNRVSRNIEVLKESDMPNITNGNLFLAGHNGNSSVSYFNKLERMNIGDSIYIYYDGFKYEYKLDNYYEINKTGEANIKRDKNRTTLVLVTCKKNSKDKQMIYVAYLENKNAY